MHPDPPAPASPDNAPAPAHHATQAALIQALQRRIAAYAGPVRQRLEQRITCLHTAAHSPAPASCAATRTPTSSSPLSDLLAHLHAQRSACAPSTESTDTAIDTDADTPAGPKPYTPAAFPELAALQDFRNLWSRLHRQQQWQRVLQPAPTDAGPLNSGRLVHRALEHMRQDAPAYLPPWLSYLDTLAWLEHINHEHKHLAASTAPRTTPPTKRGKTSTRKRREPPPQ